jgi:hypothetical protein
MFAVLRQNGVGLSRLQSLIAPVLCGLLLVNRVVEGAPLPVGGTVEPTDVPGRFEGDVAGVHLIKSFSSRFFSGIVQSMVMRNDPTNPFGSNKLTFLYIVRNNSDSVLPLDRLTIASFDNAQIDVNIGRQFFNSGDAKPTLADRPSSYEIGFRFETINFGSGIAPERFTAPLIIHTDATEFERTFASVIGGCGCEVVAETYAPVAAIPEPGTWVLAATGLIGLVAVVHQRLRAQNRSQIGLL